MRHGGDPLPARPFAHRGSHHDLYVGLASCCSSASRSWARSRRRWRAPHPVMARCWSSRARPGSARAACWPPRPIARRGDAGAARTRFAVRAGVRVRHRPRAVRPHPRERRLGGADRGRRGARSLRARPRAGRDRAGRRRDPRHAARAVLARGQPVRGAAARAGGRRRALGRPAVAAVARPPGAEDRRAAAAGAARRAQRRAAERSAPARRPADRAVAAPATARARVDGDARPRATGGHRGGLRRVS